MNQSLHKTARKKLRNGLYSLLRRVWGSQRSDEKIDPADISRILIVRVNYRIGNILFLTPLIKALSKILPQASVDVVVGAAMTRVLLTGHNNVDEVYDAPRKLLQQPIRLRRQLQALNRRNYDLVINVSALSTTNSILTALVKAPRKLGFHDQRSWLPMTHAVDAAGANPHMAYQPLHLLSVFAVDPEQYFSPLDIQLDEHEREQGMDCLQQQVMRQGGTLTEAPMIGIFRDARGDKRLGDDFWLAWLAAMRQLEPAVLWVEITVPNLAPLEHDLLTLSHKDLRKLGGILSNLTAFVCADTGPMHLASASGVPTVALFNRTRPLKYGTLGKHDLSLEIQTLTVDEVARIVHQHIFSNE